METIDYQ